MTNYLCEESEGNLRVHQTVTYGHAVMDTQGDCCKQKGGQQRQRAETTGTGKTKDVSKQTVKKIAKLKH